MPYVAPLVCAHKHRSTCTVHIEGVVLTWCGRGAALSLPAYTTLAILTCLVRLHPSRFRWRNEIKSYNFVH